MRSTYTIARHARASIRRLVLSKTPERHSQSYVVTGRARIARHNGTTRCLKTSLATACDRIVYGPALLDGNAPDARRPDQLLQKKKELETDGPSASRTQEQRYEATPLALILSGTSALCAMRKPGGRYWSFIVSTAQYLIVILLIQLWY